MTGAFHRRVEIAVRDMQDGAREARAAVEDDYHHFRVAVFAKDGIIVDTRSWALRYPNTLCPLAGGRLVELVGQPLTGAAATVMEYTDARLQCTHQFDLAALAIAALAHGRRARRYDVLVPDRIERRTSASVSRDGIEVLRWDLDGSTIMAPEPYAGRGIGSGFTAFVCTLLEDEAEAALVLRRTVYVSQGRGIDFDALGLQGPLGGCWAWQPERARDIVRLPASRLDFTGRADELAAEDRSWLAFAE